MLIIPSLGHTPYKTRGHLSYNFLRKNIYGLESSLEGKGPLGVAPKPNKKGVDNLP